MGKVWITFITILLLSPFIQAQDPDAMKKKVEEWRRRTSKWRADRKERVVEIRADLSRVQERARSSPIIWNDGHTSADVYDVKFSPDGERVLTSCNDLTVRLWDAHTQEHLACLGRQSGEDLLAEFNSNGERILIFDTIASRATLWDGRSGEYLARFEIEGALVIVAMFSPDGKRVVAAGDNGTVRFWDALTGEMLASPVFTTVLVLQIDFSPNGDRLLTVSLDKCARLWSAKTGALLASLDRVDHPVESGCFSRIGERIITLDSKLNVGIWNIGTDGNCRLFSNDQKDLYGTRLRYFSTQFKKSKEMFRAILSPDGQRLLTSERGVLKLWDMDQDGERCTLEGRIGIFSPDGDRLLTIGDDGFCRLWDGRTGAAVKSLDQPDDHKVWRALFSPDGNLIATAGNYPDKDPRLWDGRSGESIGICEGGHSEIITMRFSPTGDRLAVAGAVGIAQVWETGPARGLRMMVSHSRQITHFSLHPYAGQILTATETYAHESVHNTARLWDLYTGKELRSFEAHTRSTWAAAFSPDGKLVATAGHNPNHSVKLFDFDSGTVLREMTGRKMPIVATVFSPDGEKLATTCRDGTAQLWDIFSGKTIKVFPEIYAFTSVLTPIPAFSPDGRFLVLPPLSQRWAKVFNGSSGEELPANLMLGGLTRHTCFSPDGKYLVFGCQGGKIPVFNTESWEKHGLLKHGSQVLHLSFSPDSQRMVSACMDYSNRNHTARIWDIQRMETLQVLEGHTGALRTAVFSSDGERILTSSDDSTACLWDSYEGKLLHVLKGHTSGVIQAIFTYDGQRIVTAGFDGTLRVWDGEKGTLLMTRVEYGNGNWLAFTPQGYYVGTPEAAEWAKIRIRGEKSGIYPLSSYAGIFLSPKKVEAFLAGKVVLEPTFIPRAPDLEIASRRNEKVQDRIFHVEASAGDSYGIEKITVVQDGLEISHAFVESAMEREPGGRTVHLAMRLAVPRDQRETMIEIRATNLRGILSVPKTIYRRYEPPSRELYLLAMGVADYDDDSMDLKCPVKDVDDFIAAFKKQAPLFYNEVHVKRLVDNEVTLGEINRFRNEFLIRAGAEDTIIVFIAGHGVRTEANEYYYLTHDATEKMPYSGINRLNLEHLVTWEKLSAKKRIMFIDTCHSGESIIGARGVAQLFKQEDVDHLFQSTREGIYILAASSEDEFAREQEGNGIFTQAILDGITGGADQNKDTLVEILELMQFTEVEVFRRSGGKQKPTFPRVEGGENFAISKVLK